MKILVTAKRVIDPELKIKLKSDGSGIDTDGMNYVINPFDEIAVEEALRIKEKNGSGEVVVISIGNPEATQEIRQALAMGADRGILIKTENEADPESVTQILIKVIEEENPDLVILGKQAVDDDSNQVGQLLAEYMNWGQACFASEVELINDNSAVKVVREVDGGLESIEVTLPTVITTDLRLNEPRYATLPNIMKAKRKPLKEVTAEELGAKIEPVVKIIGYEEPPTRAAGMIVPDVKTLVDKLKNEAKVI